ncbi:MAG: peptidoglycan-binding protein [Clostridia bacterium]
MKLSIKLAVCTFITATSLLLSTNALAAGLLKVGSSGSEVSKLQQTLKDEGYFKNSVTGYYGSITKNAVLAFQRDNGLAVDGIAGSQTFDELYSGTSTNSSTLLKVGSSGNEITKLQQALKNKGYFQHAVTGYYGSITKNAVIAFQRNNGLAVDGIAGKNTLSKLYSSSTASVASTTAGYTEEDLYWLSRVIEAEAKGESYTGKVAVGNVVLNRANSNLFPNTVKGVIFEYYKGIPMFSPVANGAIYNIPGQESINAAKAALSGEKPVGSATYFFNPDKSKGTWIVNNKTYVGKIGDHAFYA